MTKTKDVNLWLAFLKSPNLCFEYMKSTAYPVWLRSCRWNIDQKTGVLNRHTMCFATIKQSFLTLFFSLLNTTDPHFRNSCEKSTRRNLDARVRFPAFQALCCLRSVSRYILYWTRSPYCYLNNWRLSRLSRGNIAKILLDMINTVVFLNISHKSDFCCAWVSGQNYSNYLRRNL